MDLTDVLTIIGCSGFLGGVTGYLVFCSYDVNGGHRNVIDLSFSSLLAIVINGLIGISGGVAIQILLLSMKFYDALDKQQPTHITDSIFLISMSLIGGFSAKAFLTKISSSVEARVADLTLKADKAIADVKETQAEVKQAKTEAKIAKEEVKEAQIETVKRLDRYVNLAAVLSAIKDGATEGDLSYAISTAEDELKKDPLDWEYVLVKSRALRKAGLFDIAYNTLHDYVTLRGEVSGPDPKISTAYYNMACYRSLGIEQLLKEKGNMLPQKNVVSGLLRNAFIYSMNLRDDLEFAKKDNDILKVLTANEIDEVVATVQKAETPA